MFIKIKNIHRVQTHYFTINDSYVIIFLYSSLSLSLYFSWLDSKPPGVCTIVYWDVHIRSVLRTLQREFTSKWKFSHHSLALLSFQTQILSSNTEGFSPPLKLCVLREFFLKHTHKKTPFFDKLFQKLRCITYLAFITFRTKDYYLKELYHI